MQSAMASAIHASVAAKKAPTPAQETDKGVRLAPAEKDLKPWYTARGEERAKVSELDGDRRYVLRYLAYHSLVSNCGPTMQDA